MKITKTANREVECGLNVASATPFIILIEREAGGPVRRGFNRKWSHDAVLLSNVEFTKSVMHGVEVLQYSQMADIVKAIYKELKRRNPIGVNAYTEGLAQAHADLAEISGAEVGNFTSECGPQEVA